jgi:hypothetical protein
MKLLDVLASSLVLVAVTNEAEAKVISRFRQEGRVVAAVAKRPFYLGAVNSKAPKENRVVSRKMRYIGPTYKAKCTSQNPAHWTEIVPQKLHIASPQENTCRKKLSRNETDLTYMNQDLSYCFVIQGCDDLSLA